MPHKFIFQPLPPSLASISSPVWQSPPPVSTLDSAQMDSVDLMCIILCFQPAPLQTILASPVLLPPPPPVSALQYFFQNYIFKILYEFYFAANVTITFTSEYIIQSHPQKLHNTNIYLCISHLYSNQYYLLQYCLRRYRLQIFFYIITYSSII